MDEDATTERLVAELGAAHGAAVAVGGREPLGVRAVEPVAGARAYLCAFDGPGFLCLDGRLVPERDARRVREVAMAGLLWEHVELYVDPDALESLTGAIGRLLALGGDPRDVMDTLERVAARSLELTGWRTVPERVVASLPAMDEAVLLQGRLHAAYSLFVRASEPLVEIQSSLSTEMVGALRAVEQAAGMARFPERLAEMLGRAMGECSDGADEIVALHITPLEG